MRMLYFVFFGLSYLGSIIFDEPPYAGPYNAEVDSHDIPIDEYF